MTCKIFLPNDPTRSDLVLGLKAAHRWHEMQEWAFDMLMSYIPISHPYEIMSPYFNSFTELEETEWKLKITGSILNIYKNHGLNGKAYDDYGNEWDIGGIQFDFFEKYPSPSLMVKFIRKQVLDGFFDSHEYYRLARDEVFVASVMKNLKSESFIGSLEG